MEQWKQLLYEPAVWQDDPENPELHWQTPLTHEPRPLHSRLLFPLGHSACKNWLTHFVALHFWTMKKTHFCCCRHNQEKIRASEHTTFLLITWCLTVNFCHCTKTWHNFSTTCCLASVSWEPIVTLTNTTDTCASSATFQTVDSSWTRLSCNKDDTFTHMILFGKLHHSSELDA